MTIECELKVATDSIKINDSYAVGQYLLKELTKLAKKLSKKGFNARITPIITRV